MEGIIERGALATPHFLRRRVDAGVLEQFRKEARRRGIGYQTLMHEVLAKHAAKGAA